MNGRLVIAGTASGVGKTSLALGLAAAYARRGLAVQTFKVGPDFLDPTYLAAASGRTCYNLDGWMTGRDYVRDLFGRATADSDLAVIEGVMGLFDGASATSPEGSTAEIAAWLDAPVLLAANAHGVARSLAATVAGFARFQPGVWLAGVIANQTGSERHAAWLAEALAAADCPPLLGAVPRGALPTLPSRHLGLVTADRDSLTRQTIDKLADACEHHLDLDRILDLARSRHGEDSAESNALPSLRPCSCKGEEGRTRGNGEGEETRANGEGEATQGDGVAEASRRVRLGVAMDAAFHFYYPDNLELLRRCGAELVLFSPLTDERLPADLDGLYLGGGYPELHAERLSANGSMRASVRDFAVGGGCVYAECGGLMYLGRAIRTPAGRRVPMAGVLPIETAMLAGLKSLGYVEVCLAGDSPLGPDGQTLRGHEFHYSEIVADEAAADGWRPAYRVRRRRADGEQAEGFCRGRVLASYVHLHFASRPQAAKWFVRRCAQPARQEPIA